MRAQPWAAVWAEVIFPPVSLQGWKMSFNYVLEQVKA